MKAKQRERVIVNPLNESAIVPDRRWQRTWGHTIRPIGLVTITSWCLIFRTGRTVMHGREGYTYRGFIRRDRKDWQF